MSPSNELSISALVGMSLITLVVVPFFCSSWGDLGLGCITPLALVSSGSPILPGFGVPLGGRGEQAGASQVMTSLGLGVVGPVLGAEEAPVDAWPGVRRGLGQVVGRNLPHLVVDGSF